MIKDSDIVLLRLKSNQKTERDCNSIRTISSNISSSSQLDKTCKNEILFLINSGFDKHKIIKVYLLLKPKNISEAVYFLSKENNLYQHIFYSSKNYPNNCKICGGKKKEHIPEMINLNNSILESNQNEENLVENGINIYNDESKKNVCKICEDEIENEEEIKRNKCSNCKEIFCDFCYYNYLTESIKLGKIKIDCPNCNKNLTEGLIIQKLYEIPNESNKEALKTINILKKNILRKEILQDKNSRFCPEINCESYAKRKNEKDIFVICKKGHKFCFNCGKKWHKKKKCNSEEEIDVLFEKYKKIYHLKECPNCKILTLKKDGCNHIKCTYCQIDWCWMCGKKFLNTEAHYNNPQIDCYNKMFENNFTEDICSKCLNESDKLIRVDICNHFICYNCFDNFIEKINVDEYIQNKDFNIKCPIDDCGEGLIYENDGLNYFQLHNKKLYDIFSYYIFKRKKENYDFEFKDFFKFDIQEYGKLFLDIFEGFYELFFLKTSLEKLSEDNNCFLKFIICILIIFQFLFASIISLLIFLILNYLQLYSRNFYYCKVYTFITFTGKKWLFYCINLVMFEILMVINLIQLILLNIVYIFILLLIFLKDQLFFFLIHKKYIHKKEVLLLIFSS